MVTAYILVQTEVGKAAQVAKDIIAITGVQQAQAVTGPDDVIVRAEARNIDELGQLVVARVQAVDGITRTSPARWSTSSAARSPSGVRPTPAATEIQAAGAGRWRAATPEAR